MYLAALCSVVQSSLLLQRPQWLFPPVIWISLSDMTQVSIKGSTSSKTNAERRETEERYRYKMFKHVEENVQV